MQMLGRAIHDPHGIEGATGSVAALGLLDFETTLQPEKQLRHAQGRLAFADAPVRGYEIHAGVSVGPALHLNHGPDGALSNDGQILATYLHGLFDAPAAQSALLAWAGLDTDVVVDANAQAEIAIDRLADAIENHLDTAALLCLLNLEPA
jgi:adenosylcobyric acid synthase